MADDIETLARVIFSRTGLSNGRSLEAAKAVLAAGYVSPDRHDADIAAAKAAARDGGHAAAVVQAVSDVSSSLRALASEPPLMLTDAAQRVWMSGVDAASIRAVQTIRAALTTGGEG